MSLWTLFSDLLSTKQSVILGSNRQTNEAESSLVCGITWNWTRILTQAQRSRSAGLQQLLNMLGGAFWTWSFSRSSLQRLCEQGMNHQLLLLIPGIAFGTQGNTLLYLTTVRSDGILPSPFTSLWDDTVLINSVTTSEKTILCPRLHSQHNYDLFFLRSRLNSDFFYFIQWTTLRQDCFVRSAF